MCLNLSFELPLRKNGRLNQHRITTDMFEEICSVTPFISGSMETLSERVYCIRNNIITHPVCCECGCHVKFKQASSGYHTYCSTKCMSNSKYVREKSIQTSMNKHGVEYHSQNIKVKDKQKHTNIHRYGSISPLQNMTVQQKSNNTNMTLYGCINPSSSSVVKDKRNNTNLARFGVLHPSQNLDIKSKISISLSSHYKERQMHEYCDYAGIVYVLLFKELDLVKIGLTGDFIKRSKSLKRNFGEFEIIQLLETDACFALEKELHERFDEYRVCLHEGGGRTEFFDSKILLKEIKFK